MASDPVATLLKDLSSNDPTIRFSVLSRIEDIEWTPESLAAFKKRMAEEADPVVRFQMQKLLARIDRASAAASPFANSIINELEALLEDESRDDLSLAIAVESIPVSESDRAAAALRKAKWWNFRAEVLPSVLQFFKKFGSAEDAAQIELLCKHSDPRVVTAAVEALEKLNPDALKELIVPLLINPVHGIRSRAIRLLYRWDPQEAVKHFEAMLFSEDIEDRNAALFHAFFFPFADIEPFMLRFLAIEQDLTLMEKAGLLFRANPMPEEPMRLVELMENTRGDKRRLIADILHGVIDSLYKAGLVSKTPEQLTLELEELYQRRKAKQLIEGYSMALASEDPDLRKRAALRLCDFVRLGYEEARHILEKWLKSETNAEICSAVEERLAAIDIKTSPEADWDLAKMPQASRSRFLMALNAEQFKKIKPALKEFLRLCTPEERLLVIQAIGRLGGKTEAGILLPYLNSSESTLAAAAIDSLAAVDIDALSPYLPKLIQHPADDVRSAALRVFAFFDKKQAISLIENMFAAVQPKKRAHAIACAAQFDFPSVRDMLLSSLRREQDPENIAQYIAIFRSNLDDALLLSLVEIAENSQGAKQERLMAFCREGITILAAEKRTKYADFDALKKTFRAQLEAEKAKTLSAKPSYALSNIQQMRKQQAAKQVKKDENDADDGLLKFTLIAFTVGAIVTAAIWFLFLAPSSEQSIETGVNEKPVAVKSFDGTPKNVSGRVIEVDAAGNSFVLINEADPAEKYRIEIGAAMPKPPELGAIFSGQIRPIELQGDLIKAQLIMAY